jgi:ABC-type transport system involved in multi-copper enzyme maturation permease subunit
LLARELTVRSGRWQTWATRSLYAIGLYTLFLVYLAKYLKSGGGHPLLLLGGGFYLFNGIGLVQLYSVALFLPAMMAGVVASEKERNTLQLLLLTGLSPTTILFEKLCSGLLPMLTFLLLGVPLLPVAFAYGGVSVDHLVALLYLLLLICLQVGTISLACSALSQTTAAALVFSYCLVAVLHGLSLAWGSHLNPIYLYLEYVETSRPEQLRLLVPASLPGWIVVVVCFGLAYCWVKRFALLPPRNIALMVYNRIDHLMTRMNRLTGGVMLVRDSDRMLAEQPVAWREMTKQSLGRARYLFRTISLLGISAMLISLSVIKMGIEFIAVLTLALWILVVIVVVVSSINATAGERIRQTLDLLLTTPMPGASIVSQKMKGIWRLVLVLGLFLLTLNLLEGWLRRLSYHSSHWYSSGELASVVELLVYGVSSAAAIAVYLPLVAWIGCWFGLRIRKRTRAMTMALATIGGLCALPSLVLYLVNISTDNATWEITTQILLRLTSPAAILAYTELWMGELIEQGLLQLILCHFIAYAGLGLLLSVVCKRNADRLLGRSAGERRDRVPEYEPWRVEDAERRGGEDNGS